MADLDGARELGLRESGLAVVATRRVDGSVQASVVNAGVVDHPATGGPVVGFVVYPYLKRFTWLSHLWLGALDGLAPVGAWVAITGKLPLESFEAWAGLDIDSEFSRLLSGLRFGEHFVCG